MRCRNAVWERGHRRKELVREIDPVLLIVVISVLGPVIGSVLGKYLWICGHLCPGSDHSPYLQFP
jgi:hypothetical protein